MTILVNAYCTLRDPPPLSFAHERGARRDRSDAELAEHLEGFVGFIFRENPQMTATLYATMRHIQRVQQHLSFEIEPSALDALATWAWQANAILFLPDGSVLNPSGEDLVDASGQSGDAALPYPADAIERRERSRQKLAELGITTPESLPPVLGAGRRISGQRRSAARRGAPSEASRRVRGAEPERARIPGRRAAGAAGDRQSCLALRGAVRPRVGARARSCGGTNRLPLQARRRAHATSRSPTYLLRRVNEKNHIGFHGLTTG